MRPIDFVLAHVNDPHDDGDPCVLWPFGTNGRGYGVVHVGPRKHRAHRYILELRGGPAPEAKMVAAHGPCHNTLCLTHVHWASLEENARDKHRDGTAGSGTSARGVSAASRVLTEADVSTIREMLADGVRQQTIAEWFGVQSSAISKISRRENWAHVL